MPSSVFSIYLSSTLSDLREERATVCDALEKKGFRVRQSYTADSESLTKSIEEDVVQCDFYVGIFAFRYGFVPETNNPDRLSITEREYQWAFAAGKPCLIFLIEKHGWPGDRFDHVAQENQNGKRIDDFRKRLSELHRPEECNSEHLVTNVLIAVSNVCEEQQRALDRRKQTTAQRASAPAMDPEARRQHPRRMKSATLLLHMLGPDEKAAQLLESTMRRSCAIQRLPISATDPPTLSMIDSALDSSRTACLLVSQNSLARMIPLAKTLVPILQMMRDRTGSCVAITDSVRPEQLPKDWELTDFHELGDWFAAGQQVVSGQFGNFIEGMKTTFPDFDDLGLLGLQYTILAMNAAEAKELATDSSTIECRNYFSKITEDLTWDKRYDELRQNWRPFDENNSVLDLLRAAVKEINGQEVIPKHDEANLHGNHIRLRYYPIDPLLRDDDDMRTVYLQQVRHRGLLVVADELSMLHPKLRKLANSLLNHRLVSVIVISSRDPIPVKFEQVLEAAMNIADLPDRFRIALDPMCELAVSTRARLRRWLRSCIPETLGSVEAQVANPELRAQFRRETWG